MPKDLYTIIKNSTKSIRRRVHL